jgi:hypothetical protein
MNRDQQRLEADLIIESDRLPLGKSRVGRLLTGLLLGLIGVGVPEVRAEFFKWEVLVFREGPGTAFETVPVDQEGTLVEVTGWACDAEKFWTRPGSELIAEGKTLTCRREEQVMSAPLVCTANNRNRRFNSVKEDYATPQQYRLYLKTGTNPLPVLLLFRCYF